MKILLDECVTKHLKAHLANFEVSTVREMNWSGIKNGKLMTLCADNAFDVLLTIDKNLQYQQNLHRYPVTIVVFNCITSKVDDLIKLLPSFRSKISSFEKSKAYIIDP